MPDDQPPPTGSRPTPPAPGAGDDATRTAAPADSPPGPVAADRTAVADPSHRSGVFAALPGVVVPGYEVSEKLAEGGMGVVFKARDTRLDRVVALKMILGDGHADDRALIRFLAEAQAAAAVRHPHVVPVLDYGDAAGRPYLALEFCPGGTLAARLKGGVRLDPRVAARLVGKVAAGVAAAHEQGIVHRDLKPANVLFDAGDEPRVTDFGLAKRVAGAEFTRTGAVMGTPHYMAPEQAGGKVKFVGPPADVWSLGVILYECLTGTRPFTADTAEGVISRVLTGDAAAPRSVVAGLPRDIDLICRECLEKNPADRYPSAKELADDLRRFAAGEPISVRPAGATERLYKWARRKPTLAAAYGLGAVAATLAAVTAGAVGLWRDAEIARGRAVDARSAAEAERGNALAAKEVADVERGKAERAGTDLRAANDRLDAALRQVEFFNYVNLIRLAHLEYQTNDFTLARAKLAACPERLRHWEWHYLHRLCHPDLVTLTGHTGGVKSAAFSPDGRRVLTRGDDKTARVWDADSGEQRLVLKGPTGGVASAAFSPDGRRVVTDADDGTARVWDADTGREVATPKGSGDGFVYGSAVFSPDGRRVASGFEGNTVRVWDAASGADQLVLEGHTSSAWPHAFSPDGRRVVTTSDDKTARVWDAGTGKELLVLRGHTDRTWSAAFSPDGRRVLTTSRDKTTRVWDAGTGKELLVLRGYAVSDGSAAFSPDGRRVVTVSGGETARVWDAATGGEVRVLEGHADRVRSAAFSPDGRRVVTTSDDKTARVWDADTGKELFVLRGSTGGFTSAAFSPDGGRVVSASDDGTARVWDVAGGSAGPVEYTSTLRGAEFSPDGRRHVSRGRGYSAEVSAAGTGGEKITLKGHTDDLTRVAFGPDGTRVVTASRDGTARVWDATSGTERAVLKGHAEGVTSAGFSPDGRRVVTASDDHTARVWDAATGKGLAVLKGHTDRVGLASFSPDGRRVVTNSDDGTARVWDAATGIELITLRGGTSATFSRDGFRIVTRLSSDPEIDDAFASSGLRAADDSRMYGAVAGTDESKLVYDSAPVNRAFIRLPVAPPPRAVRR